MILYDLKCNEGHVFEAWFKDSGTFDAQSEAGEVECPVCGSHDVKKAPMAPYVAKSRGGESRPAAPVEVPRAASPEDPHQDARAREILRQIHQAMMKLRAHVESNFDYVGDRFAEEARRIEEGEVEARGIYGEATDEEIQELEDEGIEYHRLAWVPRRTTN